MRAFGPEELLDCYRTGVFPMARDREDPTILLVDPDDRGILPLDGFHLSRRLARTVRNTDWTVVVDRDFRGVVEACAAPAPGRETTWINDAIIDLYCRLQAMGRAHSVETRDKTGALIGGLYGVSLGGAFFGESMFSTATDASKIALVHLVARLRAGGYRLLDVQFITDHLKQFGTVEVPRADYRALLAEAIAHPGDFQSSKISLPGSEAASLAAALTSSPVSPAVGGVGSGS